MAKKGRRGSHSHKQSQAEYLVIGRNAVAELLQHSPERVVELLVEADSGDRALAAFPAHALKEIPVTRLRRGELETRCGSQSHQGVAARCSSSPSRELAAKEFFSGLPGGERSLIIALDGVSDPQNLGSILRAAECFAADAVLLPKARGVSVTPTVTKVSAGASELVRWQEVSNLADWLRHSKEHGYWVVAASVGEGSESLFGFEWPERVVVVMGAEGSGVRALTVKLADFLISIPMYGKIDSLNVSQASSVMLASYRQRFTEPS